MQASAAFLFASAVTETATRTGSFQFWRSTRPFGQGLQQNWEDAHSADAERVLWPIEAQTDTEELMDTMLPGVHSTLACFVADRQSCEFLASFDSNIEVGMRNIARFHSRACHPALLWLDTLPTCMALQPINNDCVSAMRHRLALTYLPPNAPGA